MSLSLEPDSFDGFLGEKYPGPGRISLQRGSKNPREKQEEKTKIERHRVRESKMESESNLMKWIKVCGKKIGSFADHFESKSF